MSNHSTNDLPEETEKDSPFFGSCIAISPDSRQIVTFSPKTLEFKLYNVDDLNSSKHISTLESGVKGERLCWSIAISNCVDDGKNERYIALSCFDVRGLCNDIMHGDDEGDLESGDKYLRPQTWVISTTDLKEIYTSSIGGVIKFLDSDDSLLKNKTVIIIVNASGIYKETVSNLNRKQRFFSRSSKIEQFELPSIRLRLSRDHWQNSFELLHTSIIKNYFMVHSFENRQQIIEMYSLITGDLEMLFKRHESSLAPNTIHGPPIFAISQNDMILAICRGTSSITLYFMENGLEITTKQIKGQRGVYKIVAINFIDDDRKLLIVLEEKDHQRENSKHQIFVVWDLFTTFENSIRQINYSETSNPLKMDVAHRLMNSHGNMFVITDNGDIFSVLDHKDVSSIRNPTTPSEKKMTEIDIARDHVYHAIYNIDGSDASKLANRIIINNVEPWHPNKSYFRISVYLDSTESTQLIISSNTIQVWKYRNTIEKRDRVLEYIRARIYTMDVQELRIGEREFVLKVSVSSSTPPSTSPSFKPTITIHWPNNVNVLEEACIALYVLGEKKSIVIGHENVSQITYLIECTQRLVRKFITKYGIFRLTSIRYPIMKFLIKSHQESLIRHILKKKINKKNSNIYIPRLCKWGEDNNETERSKSDLDYTILCIQKRGDSILILKYLIDYYADNTKEYNNHGWMFTVSKAIPLLYDNNLREFVQYLFKKPCFGTTEAYTPPLRINPQDQKKGNNAAVLYSLAVKPCLASKFHNSRWFFLKNLFTSRIETSHNDRKVYIVPLPDFTVYPTSRNPEGYEVSKYSWIYSYCLLSSEVITDTKMMSPFRRVIHEEKGHEIYQTPPIMAVLDLKWSTTARRYHIFRIMIYILYAFSVTISVNKFFNIVFIILMLSFVVKIDSGRDMNIYRIFDLVSVFLSIVSTLLTFSVKATEKYCDAVSAFTLLTIWLEVLLLLRYFEGPGRFVYIIISILNTILPFFAFMLSAVVAFGLAMFTLLHDELSIRIPAYKIEDNSDPDLYSNIIIKQDIDATSRLDNRYSSFISSVEAVFFWTNGRWDQLDQWDNYALEIMSIIGSIILVLIFQNIGAFDEANKKSRKAARRYRTEYIDSSERPFSKKSNPRYIYYIPNPDMINNCLEETKKYKEPKSHNSSNSKKHLYIPNEGSSSIKDIEPSITEYCDKIDKIAFIDEEVFILRVTFSKYKKKPNSNLLKNESSNNDHPDTTTNIDDRLLIQKRFNNLETRFDKLEQNLETILKTLNNLNNNVS
ncbi:1467_t:CDS:2 [Diversispora eburnea]|uniref:1467_t:CDS:1 n=1 Tax=Diversispora eburnea TaxID=1213867 RepID=A0A9N9FRZ9_9GLOM|nr:1467_t:CDS:2 [Diversispora eburnea]